MPTARQLIAVFGLLAIFLGLIVSCLGRGGGGLPRARRDRPDDFAGTQIHFVYAVPSGSTSLDNHRDTDGTLSRSIVLLVSWFRHQVGSPILSVDTFHRRPDITFVRLPRTNGAYERLGPSALAADVWREVHARPRKVYATYYDGTLPHSSAEVCGVGRGGPGAFAIAFIGQACFSSGDFLSADLDGYNNLVFVMAHEIVHELGFVPACAPHSTGTGHVRDSSADLMYPVLGDGVPVLDVNNDDYYRAHVHSCPDLSHSAYLHGPRLLLAMRR